MAASVMEQIDFSPGRLAALIKSEDYDYIRPVSYTHLTLPTIYSV